VPVANEDLHARMILVGYQAAGIELEDLEIVGDDSEPRNRSRLAAARAAQRVNVLRYINDVTEVIGEVTGEPLQILRPPRIVNLADDWSPAWSSSLPRCDV